VPVGGQSVGVGVPKGGIGHTGTLVSAHFAREKPPSPSGCHRSRKSGEWGRAGDGQWVASRWGVGASPSEGLYRLVWGWGCRWPKSPLGQVSLRLP